jgi:hypothetical protein
LAAFALLVFIPTAGMTATLLWVASRGWSSDVLEFRHEWSRQLPEFMRAAFTLPIASLGPKYDAAIYCTGLLPTAELKSRALAPGTGWGGNFPWEIWHERDPKDALNVALNVPVQSVPGVPETCYDEQAGVEIGHYGTLEEVRKRLSGPYSDELRIGVASGLPLRSDAEIRELIDDILRCIRNSKGTKQDTIFVTVAVRSLAVDQKRASAFLKECFADPTPIHIVAIQYLRHEWIKFKDSYELTRLALTSNSVAVRTSCICNPYVMSECLKNDASGELLEGVIAVAEGTPPSSNVTEQRYAIYVLRQYLDNGIGAYGNSTAPLSPTEIVERDNLCARARKKLKH